MDFQVFKRPEATVDIKTFQCIQLDADITDGFRPDHHRQLGCALGTEPDPTLAEAIGTRVKCDDVARFGVAKCCCEGFFFAYADDLVGRLQLKAIEGRLLGVRLARRIQADESQLFWLQAWTMRDLGKREVRRS